MSAEEIVERLVGMVEDAEELGNPRLVLAVFERVGHFAAGGDINSRKRFCHNFVVKHETALGGVAAVMRAHASDDLMQLRSLGLMRQLCAAASIMRGLGERLHASGCLDAVVEALQRVSSPGTEVMRWMATRDDPPPVIAATTQAIQHVCEKAPNGFLALPEHLATSDAVRPALIGKKWIAKEGKWSA